MWNTVQTQEDTNQFLKETYGLHDSTIHSILYESGNYVDEERAMHFPELRRITVTLHSQCCPVVELVFEGVTALNLRPPGENYLGDIFDCTLLAENDEIFFADCFLGAADRTYQGTWITARHLRWRFRL